MLTYLARRLLLTVPTLFIVTVVVFVMFRLVPGDLPNGDLGYPTTIEYAPGELFCCYYGQEPDGVTWIQGTRVTLS